MDKQVHPATQKIKQIFKKYNASTKKELQNYISILLQKNEVGDIIDDFNM